MKRRLATWSLCGLILASGIGSAHATDPLDRLSQKLITGMRTTPCPLLAVLEFPYSLGGMNTASDLVSERLLTYLVRNRAPLVERRLLGSLLQERIWRESGVVDTKSVEQSAGLLGVEAVVIGTLADFPDRPATEVTARIVRLDTGEILSSGRVTIEQVWSDNPRRPTPPSRQAPSLPAPVEAEASTDRVVPDRKLTRTRLALRGSIDRTPPVAKRIYYSAAAVPVLAPTQKPKTTERNERNEK